MRAKDGWFAANADLIENITTTEERGTMKKLISTLAVAILVAGAFCGTALAGPSAKFAATWTTAPALESVVVIDDVGVNTVMVDSKDGYTLATIKVPQDKELLIGLSAEIALVTYGAVKGKSGGTAKAIADAEAFVTIFAVPTGTYDEKTNPAGSITAAPGKIMLSKRVQELGATLGGVIQKCEVTCDPIFEEEVVIDVDCKAIIIEEDCEVTEEQISLLLATTAAHHFNFVLADMDQGEYDIVAVFSTGADAEVDICDYKEDCMKDPDGTVSASAKAKAVINKTMLTVQEVRAVKDGAAGSTVIEIL